MTCTLHVAWDEQLTDYHFGPGHPLAPVRLELTMRLAHEFGLWAHPGVSLTAPSPTTEADLVLVHDARYITAVRTVSGWAEELRASGLEAAQFRGGADADPVAGGCRPANLPDRTGVHDRGGHPWRSYRSSPATTQAIRSTGRSWSPATRSSPGTG